MKNLNVFLCRIIPSTTIIQVKLLLFFGSAKAKFVHLEIKGEGYDEDISPPFLLFLPLFLLLCRLLLLLLSSKGFFASCERVRCVRAWWLSNCELCIFTPKEPPSPTPDKGEARKEEDGGKKCQNLLLLVELAQTATLVEKKQGCA